MVMWDENVVWRMMVRLPVLVETSFETIVRGLSPRGVGEKIPGAFAVVEKWG